MLNIRPALLLLPVVATILGACAGMGSMDALTAVTITDFPMVAGNWEGLVSGISAGQDDWVTLRISPDGKYDFGSHRTMGALGGTGTLTLSGGTMQSRSESSTATYTLFRSGAKRVLQVQSALPDGRQLSAKLTTKE
jgi:hypothetical protein